MHSSTNPFVHLEYNLRNSGVISSAPLYNGNYAFTLYALLENLAYRCLPFVKLWGMCPSSLADLGVDFGVDRR